VEETPRFYFFEEKAKVMVKKISMWCLIGLGITLLVVAGILGLYYIFYLLAIGLATHRFLVFVGGTIGGIATFGGIFLTQSFNKKASRNEFGANVEKQKKEAWLVKLTDLVWEGIDAFCPTRLYELNAKSSKENIKDEIVSAKSAGIRINNNYKLFFGKTYIDSASGKEAAYFSSINEVSAEHKKILDAIESASKKNKEIESYQNVYDKLIEASREFLVFHENKITGIIKSINKGEKQS
jgi:hypothetical protein